MDTTSICTILVVLGMVVGYVLIIVKDKASSKE